MSPGPRRLVDIGRFIRSQGFGWAAFRMWREVELRTGLMERRTPASSWEFDDGSEDAMVWLVDHSALSDWLVHATTAEDRQAIDRRVEQVHAGEHEVFGEQTRPRSWHHDPKAEVEYPSDVHWSAIAEQGADLKRVWEPSRFPWAYDFARAHRLDPTGTYADRFWELLRDWMRANTPNMGVNWRCGQETSVRLIAVVLAAQSMPETLDAKRQSWLQQLASVSAHRITADLGYARSQRNNHHSSEAAGLLAAALVLPGPRRSELVELAVLHLEDVAETLILPDGGSSQYSTNYHRVFLDALAFSILSLRALGVPVPTSVSSALDRGTDFLEWMQFPFQDEACFFGPDDGARILPLGGSPHRSVVDELAFYRAVVGERPLGDGVEAGEHLAWFGLDTPQPGTTIERSSVGFHTFPDMGVTVLYSGASVAFVRCGRPSFRVHEDDMLHVNAWVDGRRALIDPGTQSYTPAPGEPGALDGARNHNSPARTGLENSLRLSRFMLADPPAGRIVTVGIEVQFVTGEFEMVNRRGERVVRTVAVSPDTVVIKDRYDADHPDAVRNFLVGDDIILETENEDMIELPVSNGYGTWTERTAHCVPGPSSTVRIRTPQGSAQ